MAFNQTQFFEDLEKGAVAPITGAC